jgi:hypothetical protein
MDEKPVDTKNRYALILAALISLTVGLMFLVPGIILFGTEVARFLEKKEIPDFPMTFLIVFTLAMGTILLLLAYKFLFGNIERQHISISILTFASVFFIVISVILLVSYISKGMPKGEGYIKAIGGGLVIGGIGLWSACKRKCGTSNMRSDHDRK